MQINIIKLLGATALLLSLSACDAPVKSSTNSNVTKTVGALENKLPAVMLIQHETGKEELLSGDVIGHISGSARFFVTGPISGACTGVVDKAGKGQFTCDSGVTYSISGAAAGRPRMSDVKVTSGTSNGVKFVSAFGWGKKATEAAVRAALK